MIRFDNIKDFYQRACKQWGSERVIAKSGDVWDRPLSLSSEGLIHEHWASVDLKDENGKIWASVSREGYLTMNGHSYDLRDESDLILLENFRGSDERTTENEREGY